MSMSHNRRHAAIPALKASALAVGLSLAGAAHAIQFTYDNGVTGSFDTTISAGVSVRMYDPDRTLIGLANGGTSRSVNEDDGNRNFKKGDTFSEILKVTHDLELKQNDWSLFLRGLYFVDFKYRNSDILGRDGQDRLASDARVLDAFITKSFDVGDRNLRLRAGSQVLSWGESTFIPNGINVINPVDIAKLRVPGSELKEAFIPTVSLSASYELSKNASMEAFVLFNHDKIKLDPRGSYFSNNDFAADDADRVFVGFGRRRDITGRAATNPFALPAAALANPTLAALSAAAVGLYGPADPAAAIWAPRGPDRNASDEGQYGVAFRYLASQLNNTEFGLYFMNYHSRIPFFSGIKGTPTSVLTGSPLTASLCAQALITALGTSAFCDQATSTNKAVYFAEYPEDIRLYGVSFNTQGPWGVALQGEYSYRPNQPLQYATPELLLAALGAPNLITGFTQIPGAPTGATASALVPNGTFQQGWQRVKMSQLQVTATKSFPAILRADQGVLVGEVGVTKYHSLPSRIKFNGPAVYLPATPLAASLAATGAFAQQTEGFTTENSWGYRLVGRLDYSNLFMGANVSPRFSWAHDVSGTSQTFNEGVKSYSLGANFDWQKKLQLDLSLTQFFGGNVYCGTDSAVSAQVAIGQPRSYCSNANPIRDRDFYSVVVSYSF